MERLNFIWGAASSYTNISLSLHKKNESAIALDSNPPSVKDVLDWIKQVSWERISCLDESLFMSSKEREEWKSEREGEDVVKNSWIDYISNSSTLYESYVETQESTNQLWDHILSICLITWESSSESNSIRDIAQKTDDLSGDEVHIREVIRALKRIRKAEQEKMEEEKTEEDVNMDQDEMEDDVLLGIQSQMKDMLKKIQDPNSGLGKLMGEIMEDLKGEELNLDSKSLMEVLMKTMSGGGMDSLKDGPLGKILSIVERKVKSKMESGGIDELKDILKSTQDMLGKDPEQMRGMLMKILQSMVKKMGIPKAAQQMIFGQMNKVIENMVKSMVDNKDGTMPNQEEMEKMLQNNMGDVMAQMMQQSRAAAAAGGGRGMSNRQAQRRAQRMQARGRGVGRDPRLERLEKLRERLRKKAESKKGDGNGN